AIADWEGMDPATVRLIARTVREAGLITTGGRGPSAGKMTFADAANLLIAVNASITMREAPEVVRTYRRLGARSEGRVLGKFGEACEKLIEALTTTQPLPKVYLSVALPASFSQNPIRDLEVTFHRPSAHATLEISVVDRLAFQSQTRFSEISKLTTKQANKVRRIIFGFTSPTEPPLVLHPDRITYKDGTPFVVHPNDRRDTTTIGYRTLSAVAFLLEHGRTKKVN